MYKIYLDKGNFKMSKLTNIAALEYLNNYDPAVGEAMTNELKRQRRNL